MEHVRRLWKLAKDTGGELHQRGQLEALWDEDGFDEVLTEAEKLGVFFKKDDDYAHCTELELRRITQAEQINETVEETPVASPAKETDPRPEDGPGEYYQVILKDIGMAIVRTEEEPKEWSKGLDSLNELLHFDHFWFMQDETPLNREMRDPQSGRMHNVQIPRLRYYKAARGANFPLSSVRFSCWMDRDTDPLIRQLMMTSHNVVSLGSPEGN